MKLEGGAPELEQLRNGPMLPAIVFVHLGKNPAPTLMQMAKVSKLYFPEADFILITDHPLDWSQFPGRVIAYSKELRSTRFKEFAQRHPELEGISGGYWLYTTERIFCLSILESHIEKDQPVIHLESDVYSMIDSEMFSSYLLKLNPGTWIPRYSEARGIGSTIFFTSATRMKDDLEGLEELISRYPKIDNDMDLLGYALNLNILKELPTLTTNKQYAEPGQEVLFDALALGQYLFGQHPLFTNGIRTPGFQNPESQFVFNNSRFLIDLDSCTLGRLAVETDNRKFRIATLHLHSKITPGLIKEDLIFWNEAISAANSGEVIMANEYYYDTIHSQKISIINRFRRARKVGFKRHATRVLEFRIRKLTSLIRRISRIWRIN